MGKKVIASLFVPVVLMMLAVVPAAVMAQGGGGDMAEGEMMATVSCQQDYTVQADDWLSKIADKFYGDVLAFPAIAEATNLHYNAAMTAEGGDKMMAEGDNAIMAEGDNAMMTDGDDATMAEGDDKMMADGSDAMMAEGDDKTMAEGDGAMMVEGDDKMMADSDGTMMAEGDAAMMTEGDDKMMADETMAGNDTMMMAGSYAHIENPDVIEPGWVLCIPSPEDAGNLLAEKAAMAQ